MDLLSENCLWFIAFSDGFVFLSAALVLTWHGKPLLTILKFFFFILTSNMQYLKPLQ